jgi:peptide/nickel transport system permease protein
MTESRSPTTVWGRVRADKAAAASGVVFVAIVAACFLGAPLAHWILGHGPNQYFAYGARFGSNSQLDPVGPLTWVPKQLSSYPPPTAKTPRTLFLFGGDGPLGRDEFVRLLYGGRTTLEIAIGATVFALILGGVIGVAAGFYRGPTDAVASAATQFVAAFPLLLFVTAIGWTISNRVNNVTLDLFSRGVVGLVVMIGAFTWPLPARVVRAQVLELREREFVEASQMIGVGGWRIIRTQLIPHLTDTLIVYGSLILATNIVLEAALSALDLGLQPDTPDWGTMLTQNWGSVIFNAANGAVNTTQGTLWTQAFPAAALLLTIVALSLLGEGLRKALNPHELT